MIDFLLAQLRESRWGASRTGAMIIVTGDFIRKIIEFRLKFMDLLLNMMAFKLKIMNFLLIMMSFTVKMIDFLLKVIEFLSCGLRITGCERGKEWFTWGLGTIWCIKLCIKLCRNLWFLMISIEESNQANLQINHFVLSVSALKTDLIWFLDLFDFQVLVEIQHQSVVGKCFSEAIKVLNIHSIILFI